LIILISIFLISGSSIELIIFLSISKTPLEKANLSDDTTSFTSNALMIINLKRSNYILSKNLILRQPNVNIKP